MQINQYQPKPTAIATTDSILGFNSVDTFPVLISEVLAFVQGSKYTTIGTGGDYSNIGAAIAAGKSGIFILLSNVTETGNVSKTSGAAPIYVFANGAFTWSLSTYTFAYRASKFVYCAITNPNFTDNNEASKTEIVGVTVTLSATSIYYVNFSNCYITMPNSSVLILYSSFKNNTINGGGASSSLLPITCTIVGNKFTGTFASVGGISQGGTFNDNYGTVTATVSLNGTASALFSGNNLPNCTLDCNDISGQMVKAEVVSCVFSKIANGAFNNLSQWNITNCEFTTAFTTLRRVHFSNCTFNENLTIGFDDNTLTACRVGLPGGATKKVTINSGINDTVIDNLRTEAATTNNGTGSVITEKIW